MLAIISTKTVSAECIYVIWVSIYLQSKIRLDYQPLFGKWARTGEERRPDTREIEPSQRWMKDHTWTIKPWQNGNWRTNLRWVAKRTRKFTRSARKLSKSHLNAIARAVIQHLKQTSRLALGSQTAKNFRWLFSLPEYGAVKFNFHALEILVFPRCHLSCMFLLLERCTD